MTPLQSWASIACVALFVVLAVYLVYGAPSRSEESGD